MAKYYQSKLLPADVPKPPIGPLTGLRDMKGARTRAVVQGQDEVPGLGRRILGRLQGLRGQAEWLAADSTNIPDSTTNRIVGRGKYQLTPGCFLEMSIMYIPSGDTSDSSPGGNIDIEVTWTDADANTESDQFQLDLEGSTESGGAQPDGAGELWTAIKHVIVKQIRPDGLGSPATLRKWTRPPVEAEVTLENIGGCRIIDACLYEVPYFTQWEADDNPEEITVHSSETIPFMPAIRYNETSPDGDPRGGSYHLLDVHHAQIKRFGPVLFHWTSYTEDGTGHGETEDASISTGSATYVGVPDSSKTAYDATAPGWSVGNYAHNYIQNGDKLIMRGKNGSIPVRVRCYADVTDAGTGTVKVQTAPHSYIEVAITSTEGWHEAYGWLECGAGPEAHVIAQVFIKEDGSDSLIIKDVVVEYDQRTE